MESNSIFVESAEPCLQCSGDYPAYTDRAYTCTYKRMAGPLSILGMTDAEKNALKGDGEEGSGKKHGKVHITIIVGKYVLTPFLVRWMMLCIVSRRFLAAFPAH